MDDYKGPLSRFTVLDLTRVRSGPTCVRQLADWGANVIKIEAPEAIDVASGMGGARNGPDFQNLHRNKRGITLNLKDPKGVAIFKKMVKTADVVVENFRPDVKNRLGIDYNSLKIINQGIVLGSISGFGQDGPYEKRPGFDQIAQGMGGLMSITGLPGQGPVRVGIPVADLTSGIFCSLGIMIALLERDETGVGQWVQSSLLQSQIAMLDFQAARWLMNQEVAGQAGNNHPTSIPTGVFKTLDGHINIAASGDAMWVRLCDLLSSDEIRNNPDFATAELRSINRNAVNSAIEAFTLTKTSALWIEILAGADVPCGPIYAIDQMFADPQVQHLGMEHSVDHPELGQINLVGQAIKLSAHESRKGIPTPERGQHTSEVLSDLGLSSNEIQTLGDEGVI
jgi:crotonobetainyl-CoA:carnitine CoA-transferase CaiB-like acyl-CoA transferase